MISKIPDVTVVVDAPFDWIGAAVVPIRRRRH
jgi:hypothetical protein